MSERDAKPFSPWQERMIDFGVKPLSAITRWLYRMSAGRVGGRWSYGTPVMLMTTKGRKSGEPRTVPLLYLCDGDDLIIVASKAGTSRNPQWFKNLEAEPRVEVEIGADKKAMTAGFTSDEEKAALWPRLVEMYPDFGDYQARTKRNIPVIRLTLN